MTDSALTRLSWCASSISTNDSLGNTMLAPLEASEESAPLPELPENLTHADVIYLPIEHLLVRRFSFPLKHTRFLDADMIGQELADTAGIEPDDWWLTWQAGTDDNGVSGLVFGLPKACKHAMQSNPVWEQCPWLLIDAWERLNAWVSDIHDNSAIIDADKEGLFLGFYKHGVWQGMRRINIAHTDSEDLQKVASETLLSLQSMGFEKDNMPVVGRTSQALKDALQLTHADDLHAEETLESRHIYNFKLAAPSKENKNILNLRHSKWSIKHKNHVPQAWYRPIVLATMIGCLWLGTIFMQNHQLQQQLDDMNTEIIDAFHRGLPEQTVIIDAMAQLRQAVQGSGSSAGSQRATSELNMISEVFKDHPWQMQEIRINDKETVISGKVDSLDKLNTISNALQKKTSRNVKIADTDLKGNQVTFRIRWS